MRLKRQRESDACSKIISDKDQQADTNHAELTRDTREGRSLRVQARPQRIARLVGHSSVPPLGLLLIVTIQQPLQRFSSRNTQYPSLLREHCLPIDYGSAAIEL
jgi:hypothetical protein